MLRCMRWIGLATLARTGIVNPDGDKAFDEEDDCAPADVVRLQLDR